MKLPTRLRTATCALAFAGLGFGVFGAGALGLNAVRLPRWAGKREEQMEYIAGRVRALIQAPHDSDGGRQS